MKQSNMYLRDKGKASIYSADSKPYDDLKCEIHIEFKKGGCLPEPIDFWGYLTFKDNFDFDEVRGQKYQLTFKEVKFDIIIKAASAKTYFDFGENQVFFEAKKIVGLLKVPDRNSESDYTISKK